MVSLEVKNEVGQHFIESPGFHFEKFIESLNEPPVASIRCNKIAFQDISLMDISQDFKNPIPWCENGYYLKQKFEYALDPLWHAGVYYVQEASSMFVHYLLEQIPNRSEFQQLLDLCAAPGGKTQILAHLFPHANIVANEMIANRQAMLQENIIKCGSKNIIVTNNTSKDFSNINKIFDLVLLDAPCSGSGLFRKMPDYLKTWKKSFVNQCATIQEKLVHDILPTIKTNGYLMYATCSLSVEENEDIIKNISQKYNLKICHLAVPSSWNIHESYIDNRFYGYRFYPYNLHGEGFFVSLLQKQSEQPINKITHFKKSVFEYLTPNEQHFISQLNISSIVINNFIKIQDEILSLQPNSFSFLQNFGALLNIKLAGINVGRLKGAGFQPHHQLAMLYPVKDAIAAKELNKMDALNFLRKNTILFDNVDKNWILIKYQNWGLGWVKSAGQRINNYYPLHWRLRK